jgi:hypothetical protein
MSPGEAQCLRTLAPTAALSFMSRKLYSLRRAAHDRAGLDPRPESSSSFRRLPCLDVAGADVDEAVEGGRSSHIAKRLIRLSWPFLMRQHLLFSPALPA